MDIRVGWGSSWGASLYSQCRNTGDWPMCDPSCLLPVDHRSGCSPKQARDPRREGECWGRDDVGEDWSCWVIKTELSQYTSQWAARRPKDCEEGAWGQEDCKGREMGMHSAWGWKAGNMAVEQRHAVVLQPVGKLHQGLMRVLPADVPPSLSVPCPPLYLADGGTAFVLCCDLCPFSQYCDSSVPLACC